MQKVTVRKKKISNGRLSLYLEYYPAISHPKTGKEFRKEYLGIYIHEKPYTAIDKHHNKEALKQAEIIGQRKQTELNKPEIYSHEELEKLKKKKLLEGDFIEYFKTQQKKKHGMTFHTWQNTLNHLNTFAGSNIKFKDITEPLLNRFRDYLISHTGLSNNSASTYLATLKVSVRRAFKDGILDIDLATRLQGIKKSESKREYLTLEELNLLYSTDCKSSVIRNASLFSALTGLRFSDINKLTWDEIEETNEGYQIVFTQKKTGGLEHMPIRNEARELLGEKSKGRIFDKLKFLLYQTRILHEWVQEAGINKPITFHSFRHTFATLQLSAGTDIYTVSKLLGHRDLKTTAIYAKIVDKTKREAINKIKLDWDK